MTAVVTLEAVTPSRPAPADPVARIAVVVSLNFPDMDHAVADLVRRFTRVALETLVELGATYQLLDTSTPLSDPTEAARCDGLLLLGGGDIVGGCYGSYLADVPHAYGVDARADHDAFAAISAVEDTRRPILGICRGAQLLNVHRGGTIIGRAGHHQAVDTLGARLTLAAVAADGIVEGFEDPDRWLVGVQWHPEDDDGPEHDRLSLFDSFVTACAAGRRGPRHAGTGMQSSQQFPPPTIGQS